MMVQTSMKSIIVFSYLYNKEYITTVLCENKAKPQMACNGKCYLYKQIKQQEEKENTLPINIAKDIKGFVLFCSSMILELPSLTSDFNSIVLTLYKLRFYYPPIVSIFQPPQ